MYKCAFVHLYKCTNKFKFGRCVNKSIQSGPTEKSRLVKAEMCIEDS